MFHRPKNEDQNSNAAPAEPNAPAADKIEAAPLASADKPVPASSATNAFAPRTASNTTPPGAPAQPAAAAVQPAKNEPITEKETKAMTADKTETNTPAEGFSRPLDIPGTAAFQRPGSTGPQAPRVPATGYAPGAYGSMPAAANPYGSAPGTSSTITPEQARNSSRRLVVGEGITMSGEIESCDTLIVEGTVEAALKGASILDIAETGVFYGTVEIDECSIAGRFEGDITVHGRLTVKASGSITGSIAYKELAVEAGATVDGKMSPLNAAKKAEKKDGKGGKSKLGQQGGELPFSGHATAAE
jgi:cytoskeletal protein CcmA (bactofilin family)